MDNNINDPLATGLIYEDCLPLSWEVIEKLPEGWELDNINQANESFLKLFANLEDYHPTRVEHDESLQEIHHELTRIDLKLDLLLEFVGQALHRKLTLPKSIDVRVGPLGLEWSTEQAPAMGDFVKLELFLFPRYPRPVELPGKVVTSIPMSDSNKITVAFQGMSVVVQDWIEKIIFRHHRRSIANKRCKQC